MHAIRLSQIHPMHLTKLVASSLLLVILALPGRAATPEPLKEGDSVPPLYEGEAKDLGPQTVLQREVRKTHFEALIDEQFYYTDNMFLTENDERETSVLLSSAQFALAPVRYDLGPGGFAPRLGYRHQWYNFALPDNNDLDKFDFNIQTLFIGGNYQLADFWLFDLGFEWERFLDSGNYGQFYQDYGPTWGVMRLFPVKHNSFFSVSYSGEAHLASFDPELGLLPGLTNGVTSASEDALDRVDHIATVAYMHSLTPQLVAQPYYRFKFTQFIGDLDRDDYLHSVGLVVHYFFNQYASIRAFAGYDWRDSSLSSVPEYQKLDAGGGVTLALRF